MRVCQPVCLICSPAPVEFVVHEPLDRARSPTEHIPFLKTVDTSVPSLSWQMILFGKKSPLPKTAFISAPLHREDVERFGEIVGLLAVIFIIVRVGALELTCEKQRLSF